MIILSTPLKSPLVEKTPQSPESQVKKIQKRGEQQQLAIITEIKTRQPSFQNTTDGL